MKRCLVIDAGNTSTSLAICEDGVVRRVARLLAAEETGRTSDAAVRTIVRREQMDGVIIGSVVPARTDLWRTVARKVTLCHPVDLTSGCRLNVKLDYPRPATIGADRIANVCGAFLKFGGPVIVADIGTAATVDLVTADGRFIGGAIAPGPMMMLKAMSDQTALLPQIEWGGRAPDVGKSTESAMQMGMQTGYPAMIEAIARRLALKAGRKEPSFCATGGYAGLVLEHTTLGFKIDVKLTLEGMAHIWNLNK